MRRTLALLLASSSLLAACGDDGGSTPIDAALADGFLIDAPVAIDGAGPDAPSPDAAPSTVVEVPCAGATIASEVTAPGFSFTITDSTIAVDAIVRFTMPLSHSAVSGSPAGTADGQFMVGFNETKCLRFTAAGTFPFWCNPHQFTGSITVQ
jgi:plastocyanin